jgi:hypothetical protein
VEAAGFRKVEEGVKKVDLHGLTLRLWRAAERGFA